MRTETDESTAERQRRAARNQSFFREVNEQIQRLQVGFGAREACNEYICECLIISCTHRLEVSSEEYAAVRRIPDRFLVTPGHVDLVVERVVSTNERYEIVQKIGAAAELARELSPEPASNLR